MPDVPVGPARARLENLRTALEAAGIRLLVARRGWDQALWPRAARGFFPFWQDVSGELAALTAAG
jgi:deoxyribodipyrimidine photo-lyase